MNTWVVPNRYTLPGINPSLWASDGASGDPTTDPLQDWYGLTAEAIQQGGTLYPGHGTAVASVAGGATLGVASKASLYLVKSSNAYRYSGGTGPNSVYNGYYVDVTTTTEALDRAFQYIYQDVVNNGKAGKAVVNLCDGKSFCKARSNLRLFVESKFARNPEHCKVTRGSCDKFAVL